MSYKDCAIKLNLLKFVKAEMNQVIELIEFESFARMISTS